MPPSILTARNSVPRNSLLGWHRLVAATLALNPQKCWYARARSRGWRPSPTSFLEAARRLKSSGTKMARYSAEVARVGGLSCRATSDERRDEGIGAERLDLGDRAVARAGLVR